MNLGKICHLQFLLLSKCPPFHEEHLLYETLKHLKPMNFVSYSISTGMSQNKARPGQHRRRGGVTSILRHYKPNTASQAPVHQLSEGTQPSHWLWRHNLLRNPVLPWLYRAVTSSSIYANKPRFSLIDWQKICN